MRKIQVLILFVSCLLLSVPFFSLHAQTYQDHFGTGNNVGISISSSSEEGTNTAAHTLNGAGNFTDMAGASRFLAQAGFGGTYEEIEYVTQIGIDAWLDEQFAMTSPSFLDSYYGVYADVNALIEATYPNLEQDYPDFTLERARVFTDFVFWDKVFKQSDMLRNKAAFALGQILVLSTRSIKLNKKGFGGSDYHDILYQGAFGNFRDMLYDVSTHLIMGYYLSHFKNEKGDPSIGTLPDENFAREIMQLFTIGLHELNNDGTYKLDSLGQTIPTYDITDIQELAKVFTGLSGGAWDTELYPQYIGQPMLFNRNLNHYDMRVPMIMWEDRHEQGEKVMIDGSVIPAGQDGMQDINDALDVLFNHPNVGPFIGTRLIQQLVKSNPTPAYVNRVAMAFNDNGQGVRGDMKAVFEAILTDPEARDCSWIENEKTGKLRQPLERFITLLRAFDLDSPSGKLWFADFNTLYDKQEQVFMGSPTVFNFFSPFYAEDNYVAPNGMVSPEFEILHSVTSIHYLNFMEDAIMVQPFRNSTAINTNNPRIAYNNADTPFLDFSDEVAVFETQGLDALLDRLNILLCNGNLTDGTRSIISNMITELDNAPANFTSEDKVKNAIYFMAVSADYTILK